MLVEQQRPRSQAAGLRVRRVYRLLVGVAAILGATLIFSHSARATYQDTVGYPQLQSQLGASIPTGAGIVVQHVEALNSGNAYIASPIHPEFTGKAISNVTLSSGAIQGNASSSGHATAVGANFYGNTVSIAPGITSIQAYDAYHWLGYNYNTGTQVVTPNSTGFLNAGSGLAVLPDTTTARVANHSYVAQFTTNSVNSEILRRLDYVVERDDFINVVGVMNGNGGNDFALLKSAFNEVSVGRTDGIHRESTLGIDSVYTAGRNAPDLVASGIAFDDSTVPATGELAVNTSNAAPMVSAAVAMLLETGQDASLSTGTITNRSRTVNHAETSEVIKAVLMAGADRAVDNPRGPDLATYAVDTANNLDLDYGAGQLNIFNSYNILAGGEHDSDQDRGGHLDIHEYGWDYDRNFGGAGGTNNRGSYFFTAANDGGVIHATLAWNIQVNAFTSDVASTTLRDLNLLLVDVTNNQILTAVGASSTSTTENTENIFFSGLVAGNQYEIRVEPAAGQPAFDWDYGLAWRISDVVGQVPEPSTAAFFILGALSIFGTRRGQRRMS